MQLKIILFFVLISTSCFAQRTSHLFVGGGYSFAASNKEKGLSEFSGRGGNAVLGYQLMFSDRIGVQLQVQYQHAQGPSKNNKADININNGVTEIYSNYLSTNAIYINPSLILGILPRRLFYARAGVFTTLMKTNSKQTFTSLGAYNSAPLDKTYDEMEITGKLALGLNVGLGTEIKLTQKFSVFLDASYNKVNFTQKHGVIAMRNVISYDQAGVPHTLIETYNTPISFNSHPGMTNPSYHPEMLLQTISVDNITMNAGIMYKLSRD